MVLLTLTLLAAPLGAAHPAGVAPAAINPILPVAEAPEAPQAEPAGSADRHVANPRRSFQQEGGKWVWQVPKLEFYLGVLIGVFVAGLLVLRLLATSERPTLIEPALSRRWLNGSAGSLAKDPLVWLYLIAVSGFAGAAYSGAFDWFSRGVTQSLSGFVNFGPAGAGTAVVALLSVVAKRRMLGWNFDTDDADALATVLDKKSASFLGLVRFRLDDKLHRRILGLATANEVGLIQRTMWKVSAEAVDQGRLQPAEREEFIAGLLAIPPGQDDRSDFLNRRAAVDLATRLVAIEELEAHLGEEELRKPGERREAGKGPEGAERRTGDERRVRSLWRPAA